MARDRGKLLDDPDGHGPLVILGATFFREGLAVCKLDSLAVRPNVVVDREAIPPVPCGLTAPLPWRLAAIRVGEVLDGLQSQLAFNDGHHSSWSGFSWPSIHSWTASGRKRR